MEPRRTRKFMGIGAVCLATAAVALLASVSLLSCSDTTTTAIATPPASPGGPGTTPAVTTIHIQQNASSLGPNAFGVNPLVIIVNTTITWVNDDSVTHTSTSDDDIWDSGPIQPGGNFSRTFPDPGTFPYHDTNFPSMTGTIQVTPSPSPSPIISPSPSVSPQPSPEPSPSVSPAPSPSFAP